MSVINDKNSLFCCLSVANVPVVTRRNYYGYNRKNIEMHIFLRYNVGKIGTGEIDFIATRQNEKVYVQVTQEINSEKTEKREYERLLAIRDNYPKYVLTASDFAGGNYEGIKTMHIAEFLLNSNL